MTSTLVEYRVFERTYVDRIERTTQGGRAKKDIEYFVQNINKVRNAEDLIADDRLYRFAMIAFDMESQIFAKGMIKKVLEEGVTVKPGEPPPLAIKLSDQKFRQMAAAFAFAETGTKNVNDPEFVTGVVERFLKVSLETQAGEENIAVRLAAYFERKAPVIKNWYNVLADTALREVVFTALNLPDEIQTVDPDRLVKMLADRFEIEDFQDPERLQKFIERFAVMYDVKNGAPGGDLGIVPLFSPLNTSGAGPQIISIDPSTLAAIKTFS